jgi:hypothetical protein
MVFPFGVWWKSRESRKAILVCAVRFAQAHGKERCSDAANLLECARSDRHPSRQLLAKKPSHAMLKSLQHLTSKDKLALAIFLSLALLCSVYFASGILVTYVSSPASTLEMSKDGTGFTVRVLGFQTFAAAEQLSTALQDQRRVKAAIENAPGNQGYLVKVGPLTRREAAEDLTAELHNSGYGVVKIVQTCAPGVTDCPPSPPPATPKSVPVQGK